MYFKNGWLLATQLALILLLVSPWTEVEAKKRKKGRRHRTPRARTPPPVNRPGPGNHNEPDPGPGVGRHMGGPGQVVIEKPGPSCPPPTSHNMGQIQGNISELWNEVHYLLNPIHVHVDGVDSHLEDHYGGHDHGHGHGHGHHNRHRSHNRKGHHKSHKGHHKSHKKGKHGGHASHKGGSHGRRTPGHGHDSHIHNTHIHVHVSVGNQTNPCKPPEEYRYARCDLVTSDPASPVKGTILLRQKGQSPVEVKVNVSGMAGLRPKDLLPADNSDHGFHVHQFADFSKGCKSFGSHYNPSGEDHGPGNDTHGHAGDWGNIQCNPDGDCVQSFNTSLANLYGPESVIGRGIVLHQAGDDLGQGNNDESLRTGNAGSRVACCAIVFTAPPSSDDDW